MGSKVKMVERDQRLGNNFKSILEKEIENKQSLATSKKHHWNMGLVVRSSAIDQILETSMLCALGGCISQYMME